LTRRDLIRAGIDLDNWQRKSASFLTGSLGSIIGGMMGGPLGLLLGTLLWTVGQSAQYNDDRSPEEVKQKYREAARFKAVESVMRIVADNAHDRLHPQFRKAFHDTAARYGRSLDNYSANQIADLVGSILSSVDYKTASNFQRLYSAAVSEIG
jgi:hypothetical protein